MSWEFKVLEFLQGISFDFLDKIMIFVSGLCNNGYIWIFLTLILLISKRYRKIGITCAIALIIMQISGNMIFKPLIDRPRPYEIRNIELLIPKPEGSSFPSGHSFSSFATATAILMWNRKMGIGAYILAILVAFSRMYLYVHFPTDILGALILGIIDGVLSYYVVKNYIAKKV